MSEEKHPNLKRKTDDDDPAGIWRWIVEHPVVFSAAIGVSLAAGYSVAYYSGQQWAINAAHYGAKYLEYPGITEASIRFDQNRTMPVLIPIALALAATGVGASAIVTQMAYSGGFAAASYVGSYALDRICKRRRPNNADTELKSIQTVRDFPKEFKQVCNMSISAIPPDADRDELTLVFTRFIGEMKGTQRDRACFVFSSLYRGRLIWLMQDQLLTEEGHCRVTPAPDGDFLIHKNTKPPVRYMVKYSEIAGDEAEDIVRNFKNAEAARACKWLLRPTPFFTHVDDSRQ